MKFTSRRVVCRTKQKNIIKALVIVLLVLCVGLLIYFAFIKALPDLASALKSGNESEIEAYLRSSNSVQGILCTAILQMIQVVSIVFPGAAVQMAAGIVYGALRGFLICHIAETVAHSLVFFAARNLGATMNKIFPSSEKSASKLNFIKESGHPTYMTVVAYLVPLMPNGIIPYVAASTHISFWHFIIAVFAGTFLPTLAACAAGSYIVSGSYFTAALVLVVLAAAAFLLWHFRDNVLETVTRLKTRAETKKNAEKKKLSGVVDFNKGHPKYKFCGIRITESFRFEYARIIKWLTPIMIFTIAVLRIFDVPIPNWTEITALLLTVTLYLLGRHIESDYRKRLVSAYAVLSSERDAAAVRYEDETEKIYDR